MLMASPSDVRLGIKIARRLEIPFVAVVDGVGMKLLVENVRGFTISFVVKIIVE